jgi:hypothetical protein
MVEKADKLLITVVRLALGDNRAIEQIEGSEQRGGVMTIIIVSHPLQVAQPHRQHWLGALRRLNLAFLIDVHHQCLVWRIEVKPRQVANFFNEERVGGEFKGGI